MDTPCVFCDHPKNKTHTNCAKCGRLLKPKADTSAAFNIATEKPSSDSSFSLVSTSNNNNPNLFTCKDCNNLCSKTAKACPKCGCVFNSSTNNLDKLPTKQLAIGAAVLVAVIFGAFYFLRPVSEAKDLSISRSAVPPTATVHNVKGEVFITTKGRDNIKLGGTVLTIYKKDEVKKVIETKIKETSSNPKSTSDFFSDISSLVPVAKAQTDSDGKYSLDLPKGSYVVMVYDNRRVFDKTEFYHWLVKLDVDRDGIVLPINNSNMLPDEDSRAFSPLYHSASEIY